MQRAARARSPHCSARQLREVRLLAEDGETTALKSRLQTIRRSLIEQSRNFAVPAHPLPLFHPAEPPRECDAQESP